MMHLIPDELFAATCQLACYGFAMLTAAAACFCMPRW